MYSLHKSSELFANAQSGITNGVGSSMHKYSWQQHPIYVDHGMGSRLYDVDGNEYIDYLMGFGPNILGYANQALSSAVASQIDKVAQVAAPTAMLGELADKMVELIPCAEKVSTFYNSGTEACLHALRLARAYTGKWKIVKFEGMYHGWGDELKVSNSAPDVESLGPRNCPYKLKQTPGQRDPDDIIILPYNDLALVEQTFKRHGHEIAAVICEQIMFNCNPVYPMEGYLEGLRELTRQYDILLIFDEVITGFRCSLGGAQKYFGVTPDIGIFAKAMGGGLPISAVVGKKEVVAALSATAGTFNGNPLCVAASLATIRELEKPGVYEAMGSRSEKLLTESVALGKKYGVKMHGRAIGATWSLNFGVDRPLVDYRDGLQHVDFKTYEKFAAGCLERGVWLNPWRGRMYMSIVHSDADIEKTLCVFDEVLAGLSKER